jgi:hypothetical protein
MLLSQLASLSAPAGNVSNVNDPTPKSRFGMRGSSGIYCIPSGSGRFIREQWGQYYRPCCPLHPSMGRIPSMARNPDVPPWLLNEG